MTNKNEMLAEIERAQKESDALAQRLNIVEGELNLLKAGLRHISEGRTPDGQSITAPQAYARAWLDRTSRIIYGDILDD